MWCVVIQEVNSIFAQGRLAEQASCTLVTHIIYMCVYEYSLYIHEI